MRKSRRDVVLATLAATALAGAAWIPGPARAAEPGMLLIWYTTEGTRAMRQLGGEFTRKTGVPVAVDAPIDGPGRFQQAAAAGQGPDIWVWAHDRLGEWASGGLLVPLSPSRQLRADIAPLAWQAVTIDDKIWGYPLSIEAVALVYNKALVSQPPKSFEEVLALDRKLSAQGRKALIWPYANAYFSWPLLAAGGGYAFKRKADGTYDARDSGVNNAGAVTGTALVGRLVREKYMPQGSDEAAVESAMVQGHVAMMINGPWMWKKLRQANIDFGVAPIPTVAGRNAVPFVGVRALVINKSSPNKDLAIEFIENYMLTAQGLKTLNDVEPIDAPASKAFLAELKGDPNVAATLASAEDGVPMPNNPEMARFWPAMASALTSVATGKPPQAALDVAARLIADQ
jgi:maltose/maltodextrin transport system substrate-binding protein